MKPRAIGIVAGGGGPMAAAALLQEIISECQRKYNSWRSYEFPCINFYSYPYSEMLLINNSCGLPSRELSFSIQQLKLNGMDIVIIPCFTVSSYLTYRSYGIELIEIGALMKRYLEKNGINNPLVLCSERTRQSGYCNGYFACHYPPASIQKELNTLIEMALKGEKINIQPLLQQLPKVPILCAVTTINVQLVKAIDDPLWINPIQTLVKYAVQRSYEGSAQNIRGLKVEQNL